MLKCSARQALQTTGNVERPCGNAGVAVLVAPDGTSKSWGIYSENPTKGLGPYLGILTGLAHAEREGATRDNLFIEDKKTYEQFQGRDETFLPLIRPLIDDVRSIFRDICY